MMQQKALATPNVITGLISIFEVDAHMLIDPRAAHSFISYSLVAWVYRDLVPSNLIIKVLMPT